MTESHYIANAMDLGETGWQKPWSGTGGGNCLEVKPLPAQGKVAMRQSTDPEGPALLFDNAAMADLIDAVKSGGADFLL